MVSTGMLSAVKKFHRYLDVSVELANGNGNRRQYRIVQW